MSEFPQVQPALAALAAIRLVAPTAVIAGGCARDVYHGVAPKDFDVIVPLGTDMVALRALVSCMAEEGSYRAFAFIAKDNRLADTGYSEVDRVLVCLKMTYKGIAFDVLLYNVTTGLEAVDYFDANLNQFVLTDAGTPVFAGKVHPADGLIWVRGDANQKRMDYIHAKHQKFYPELYPAQYTTP